MATPTLNYVPCPDPNGGHRMAYWSWGDDKASRLVVCVHGLSRQGRDFDVLAKALVERSPRPVRVVCPDVVGRGKSDWLKDPQGYAVPTYAADMLAMLAQLQAQAPIGELSWVGTSMGGLIGMAVAGMPNLPLPAPISRLVLNDVGPAIQWEAIRRISGYIGQTGRFDSVQQAADAMWSISTTFGPHTPQQWFALSEPMVRPLDEGGFTLHYDPAISVPIKAMTEAQALQAQAAVWGLYDNIKARTLLLRGAVSDLLSPATAQEMVRRGPQATLVEFEGIGHAPTLVADNQVGTICEFLLR